MAIKNEFFFSLISYFKRYKLSFFKSFVHETNKAFDYNFVI